MRDHPERETSAALLQFQRHDLTTYRASLKAAARARAAPIIAAHREGMPIKDIAAVIGVSAQRVSEILIANGVFSRPKRPPRTAPDAAPAAGEVRDASD